MEKMLSLIGKILRSSIKVKNFWTTSAYITVSLYTSN
jgi:hypothetical protein